MLRLNVELAKLDKESDEYAILIRRKEAYTEGFPEKHIEDYSNYYNLSLEGYRQERYLLDNPEFAELMHGIKGIETPDSVPSVKYDELLEKENKTPTDLLRMDAYKAFVPETHIQNYVSYYSIIAAGKPDDWPKGESYYEDDWFFM